MALKIRMARGGSKKSPFYRVVVADSRCARDGKFIEKIGTHNPLLRDDHPERFVINEDRAKYWLSVGAQTSERVNKYLSKIGLEEAQTRFEKTKKSQPKKKAQERLASEIEKQKKAAEEAEQASRSVEEENPEMEASLQEPVVTQTEEPVEEVIEAASEPETNPDNNDELTVEDATENSSALEESSSEESSEPTA